MPDPIYFSDLESSRKDIVEIRGRTEICQGGPRIGSLFVNGIKVGGNSLFGGPMLEENGYLFLPKREKGWLFNGFKLVKVDLNTLELSYLGVKSDLIFLKRIKDGYIYFMKTLDDAGKINEYRIKI